MRSIATLIIAYLLLFANSALAQSKKQEKFPFVLSKNTTDNARTKPQKQTEDDKAESLDFSDTGRPGQQTAGESRGSCSNLDNPLEAVVPISHTGKTTVSHPSFWVYFPYSDQQISHVELVLQNEAREDIWRSQYSSAGAKGYKSFSVPKTAPPLEVGQWYRWYIKVYCDSQTASSQFVQSWIERVPLTSQLYLELGHSSQPSHQTYSSHGIWYDAVDRLLQKYRSQPSNLKLEQDWQNLIRARGVNLNDLPQVGASYEAVK